MSWQDDIRIWERFAKPLEVSAWSIIIVAGLLIWVLPLTPAEHLQIVLVAGLTATFILVLFRWLVPRVGLPVWLYYVSVLGGISLVAAACYVLYPYEVEIDLVYVIIVTAAGILVGWPLALLAALLAAAAEIVVFALWSELSASVLLTEGLHLTVFIAAGYLASALAGTIRQQAEGARRRSSELHLLLDTGLTAAASLNLDTSLPQLAERIARGLPATSCRICLLDPRHEHLVIRGAYVLRPEVGWEAGLGQRHPLGDLPLHRRAIETGQPVVVHQDDASSGMSQRERDMLFFVNIKVVCLVPLVAEGQPVGVISVGDARLREQMPFDQQKLNLLQTLAAQVAVVIQNARLHEETERRAERMSVLNEVAQAVGSTIELDQLLELIYQQLSRVIPTDTYYVALYDPSEEVLDVRILIDEGQRFPSKKLPVGQGLSSLVIRERRPLLVRHVSEELDSLPVKPVYMGHEKMSESWLGVPMVVGEHFMGLLAVASYQLHAFDEEDLALLSSVAQQAALALDNARHHAEVEEQARRDSLTGVYNHNHFLIRLNEEVERARETGSSVSLIMLDIDYFKEYNDTYGHVVGDEVLRLTVQAIQAHVKKTDVVGRWGGEEFGIVLRGATTAQAKRVAQRIRCTLAELELVNDEGHPIPKPTVSQGIANFPEHVSDANRLVQLADQALYRAKSAGRDQVGVAEPPSSFRDRGRDLRPQEQPSSQIDAST
jgi:diguanylate cyclase (GGDEF)-like protein